MSLEPLTDPFGLRADPDRYVPRPATEMALDELERGVLLADSPVALYGPPGIGKTLLLRVLGRRLATSYRAAYLPYPLLTPRELCRWALMELDELPTDDPETALREVAKRSADRELGVLLLIDDADALPLRTAQQLFAMFHESDGDLRIVMGAADQERAARVFERSGEELTVVRLADAMSRTETAAWLHGQLRGMDDDACGRFDDGVIDALHETSEGLPGPLQSAATAVLRGEPVTASREPLHALSEIEAEIEAGIEVGVAPGLEPLATPEVRVPSKPEPDATSTGEDATPPEPVPTSAEPDATPAQQAVEPPRAHRAAEPRESGRAAEPREPGRAAEPRQTSRPAEETLAEPGSGLSPQAAAAPPRKKRTRRKKAGRRLPRPAPARSVSRPAMAAAGIALFFAGAFVLTLAWPFGGDDAAPERRASATSIDVAAPPPARPPRAPATIPMRPATRVAASAPAAAAPLPAVPDVPATEIDAAGDETSDVGRARSDLPRESAAATASEATPEMPDAAVAVIEEVRAAPVPAVAVPAPVPVPVPVPEAVEENEVASVEPTPAPTPTAPALAPAPVAQTPIARVPIAQIPVREPQPAPRPLVAVEIEAPAGARIEIDGRPMGAAPLEALQIRSGRRRIVARLADGSVMQRTVEIGPDPSRVIFY